MKDDFWKEGGWTSTNQPPFLQFPILVEAPRTLRRIPAVSSEPHHIPWSAPCNVSTPHLTPVSKGVKATRNTVSSPFSTRLPGRQVNFSDAPHPPLKNPAVRLDFLQDEESVVPSFGRSYIPMAAHRKCSVTAECLSLASPAHPLLPSSHTVLPRVPTLNPSCPLASVLLPQASMRLRRLYLRGLTPTLSPRPSGNPASSFTKSTQSLSTQLLALDQSTEASCSSRIPEAQGWAGIRTQQVSDSGAQARLSREALV